LKAAQLQLGSLTKLVKEQAVTIAALKAKQPKRSRKQPSGHSDLPRSIEDRREMISHLRHRFALMNNPFFLIKLEGHLVASTRPNVASNDSEPYQSDAAMHTCLLAEVYEVVPSDLHAAMQEYRQFEHLVSCGTFSFQYHSLLIFINQFTKAGKSFLCTVMSDLWSKILPVIFGSIPQIVSRLKANFDRSEIKEFDALLKPESELARKKYTKYAPILFPNHQTDMSMLFMSRELALVSHCLNLARGTFLTMNQGTEGPSARCRFHLRKQNLHQTEDICQTVESVIRYRRQHCDDHNFGKCRF
jgi:hypothetical protein